jgi:phage terminase large subunit
MNVNVQFPVEFQFLFEPARYKVAYGGRGGGKSWAFARALLLIGASRPIRVLCAREIQRSINESVHQVLRDQIEALGLQAHYDVLQTEIRGKNGTLFVFAGLRHNIGNIKSKEGLDIVWVEEADGTSDASWETLLPTIRKDGSEIWVSFNPNLDTDPTYKRFVANPPPGAVVVKVGWETIGAWLSKTFHDEREELLRTDPIGYQTIYGGHCRKVLPGAVYTKELLKATEENRITKVPYDASKPVHTFWDLGFGDDTSIWFAQSIGFEFRLIDYYGNRGHGLPHYLQVLQTRGYVYGEDWLPHDGQAKTLGTGKSIEDMLRAAGRKVQITPKLSVEDGINAARTVFGRCWFDEQKCVDGLQCLQRYRYEIDPDGNAKRTPLHDRFSHGADAFRYFAVAMKEPRKSAAPKVFVPQYAGNWMG